MLLGGEHLLPKTLMMAKTRVIVMYLIFIDLKRPLQKKETTKKFGDF